METNQEQPIKTQEQLLQEIWKYTMRTERYMRWQLYITLILVVLPLLAMVFIIPMVMNSIGSVYGGGLLQ